MHATVSSISLSTSQPVTIDPYPPTFWITRAGGRFTPNNNIVKTFPAGTGSITLARGDNVTYKFAWDQLDDNGKQVLSGSYGYNYRLRAADGSQSISGGGLLSIR
jgi:hypothetical protein